MNVRAKFKVESVTKYAYGGAQLKLSAVTGGAQESDENKRFWKATPSGAIELNCLNVAAAEQFVPGDEFYVDFVKAPPAPK